MSKKTQPISTSRQSKPPSSVKSPSVKSPSVKSPSVTSSSVTSSSVTSPSATSSSVTSSQLDRTTEFELAFVPDKIRSAKTKQGQRSPFPNQVPNQVPSQVTSQVPSQAEPLTTPASDLLQPQAGKNLQLQASKKLFAQPQAQSYFAGHRERLRKRFLHDSGASMPDYEILELLLCLAQPRKDMKSVAKRLLKHFGTLDRIMNALPEQLTQVEGVGSSSATFIVLLQELSRRIRKAKVSKKNVLSNWQNILDYCQHHMQHQDIECLHIMFLSQENVLLADRIVHIGTVNHVSIYPREIFKLSFQYGAAKILLIHNHPSGDPSPSKKDIEVTQKLKSMSEYIGVKLFDHLIVGRDKVVSMKNIGWI